MYVITFYSFKGGVGRTLSMMNVCANLALSGKKVLLVDFDLEAPGLDAFPALSPDPNTPGIVEFITDYLRTGVAPSVKDYITVCKLKGEHEILLMRSGAKNRDYSSRLSSIDWQRLYAESDGYLLFEDLKAQWHGLNPDYVLIDSRTGHTDIGGVCTRQLPDAVVACFIPNEDNLAGLETIVADIRQESKQPYGKSITVHFVASNLPNLDDENGILRRRLAEARSRLGFERPAGIISRYESLSLLENEIFSLTRRNTRLAKEYRRLTTTITEHNLADRDVALRQLRRMREGPTSPRSSLNSFVKLLGDIQTLYARDGEVLDALSHVSRLLGRDEEAQALIERAESLGYRTAASAIELADRQYSEGDTSGAIGNLRYALSHPSATFFELSRAAKICLKVDPNVLLDLKESAGFRNLGVPNQTSICELLLVRRNVLPIAENLLQWIEKHAPSSDEEGLRNKKMLCLISGGKFRDAMNVLAPTRPSVAALDTPDAFNYAVAEWGATHIPPSDMFRRVLDTVSGVPVTSLSKNFLQCVAIAAWVCEDKRLASEFLGAAGQKAAEDSSETFSGWQYLQVSAQRFRNDLEQVAAMIRGEPVIPAVLSDAWSSSSVN